MQRAPISVNGVEVPPEGGAIVVPTNAEFEWHYQFDSDGIYPELWIDPHTILAAPLQAGPGTLTHRKWGPNKLEDVSAFDSAAWNKTGGTTVEANMVNDPAGNLVADKINSTANTDEIQQSEAVGAPLAGQTWVVKIFLRASVSHAVRMLIDGFGGTTPAGNASGNVNTTITTEWQEYILSHTFDNTTTWESVRFRLFPTREYLLGDTTGLNYVYASDASMQRKETLSTYPVSVASNDVTEFEVTGVDAVRPRTKLVAVKLQKA